MTSKRSADFDLAKAVEDPGFSPRARDAPALVDLYAGAEGELERLAERALERLGPSVATVVLPLLETADDIVRRKMTELLGGLSKSGDETVAQALVARLSDSDARTRRVAASALGRARIRMAEPALVGALEAETDAPTKRAITEALGKIGGEAAKRALENAPEGTEHTAARARLVLDRDLSRSTPSSIDADAPLTRPVDVVVHCRAGLEPLLLDELASLAPKRVGEGVFGPRLELTLEGPMRTLYRSRTMLGFGFALPVVKGAFDTPEKVAEAVAGVMTSPDALALMRATTKGPLRFRVAWAKGGKRRATLWKIAAAVDAKRVGLLNDPVESPWEAVVHEAEGQIGVELCPRAEDPRFTYRLGDVPASSHPTIAAALVRVGGARPDDVVWDPFVGSGTELCERAILGRYELLIGSDRSPDALAVARANLEAAKVARFDLSPGDARSFRPKAPPTLIVTNPPLGRRVERSAELATLLESFLGNAARWLEPGGRLVWISPFPTRTRAAAERAGLVLASSLDVDLGGFTGVLERFDAPFEPARRASKRPFR